MSFTNGEQTGAKAVAIDQDSIDCEDRVMQQAHELVTAAAKALTDHRYSEAEELYRRAIQMIEATDPQRPSELDIAHCFTALAELLERQGKKEEAQQLKKRAIQISAKELNERDGFDR